MSPYSRAATLDDLLDKAAIVDLLSGYAYGIDRREWALYRSIFADPLEVDLAWSGVATTMAADAWVATVAATLGPFDATQHRMTNAVVALAGDRATLTCQMTARHMLEVDGDQHIHLLAGRYEHGVARFGDGWRIAKLRLVITMEQGDRGLFERAAALGPRARGDVGEQGHALGAGGMTLDELADRAAITDVIHRYARAMDRMDRALALSCWHPGGTDDHAPLYAGSAAGFIDWLWPVHAAMIATRHVVTNLLIALDGDRAGTESYWTVTLRMRGADGGLHDIFGQGRYIDSFEKIDGIWAIRHRQSLHDWDRVDPVAATMADASAPVSIVPNNPEVAPTQAARDRSDCSYRVLERAGR